MHKRSCMGMWREIRGERERTGGKGGEVTTIELIGIALNQLLRNKLCRFIATIQDENRISLGPLLNACNNERVSFGLPTCEMRTRDSEMTRNTIHLLCLPFSLSLSRSVCFGSVCFGSVGRRIKGLVTMAISPSLQCGRGFSRPTDQRKINRIYISFCH